MVCTQLPMILVYQQRVKLNVGHYARLLPLQATVGAPRVAVDPAQYLAPPLRPQAAGWHPEWGKLWEWYGIGRYSF